MRLQSNAVCFESPYLVSISNYHCKKVHRGAYLDLALLVFFPNLEHTPGIAVLKGIFYKVFTIQKTFYLATTKQRRAADLETSKTLQHTQRTAKINM